MITYLAGHKVPAEARKSEGFQALMRGHMNIAEKDLAWALKLARQSGVALPGRLARVAVDGTSLRRRGRMATLMPRGRVQTPASRAAFARRAHRGDTRSA